MPYNLAQMIFSACFEHQKRTPMGFLALSGEACLWAEHQFEGNSL